MESDPIQFPGDERASPFQCLLFGKITSISSAPFVNLLQIYQRYSNQSCFQRRSKRHTLSFEHRSRTRHGKEDGRLIGWFNTIDQFNSVNSDANRVILHLINSLISAEFLVLKCGFAEDKASDVRERLYLTYGTTLAGLKALGFEVNDNEYHDFVLPIELIQEDPNLRSLLQSIKQRKLLFTDSRLRMAVKILQKLGVEDCFQDIICFETMNQHPPETSLSGEMLDVVTKPSIEAMNIAIDVAGVDPHCTLFLDDEEDNVSAGKAVGFRTVLVGKRVKSNEADFVVERLVELRQAVPEIWALGSDD
ncbi:hypothetical protein Syun_007460 [Stephania yunnanensis]|uniref:Uncharacterized protein n=1 Tax=Stephania yunnanensis TaxID=152371 RepID=A0AAP0L0A0_9MAGN